MEPDQNVDRVIVRYDVHTDSVNQLTRAFRTLFERHAAPGGLLALLARHLPIAAFATGPDGTVTTAFGTALDRIGLGEGQMIGMSSSIWGSKARDYVAEVSGGRAHVFDVDGEVAGTPFRHRVFGVPDGAGGALAIVVDLSDARAVEDEIDANRALLESAIELSGTWMIVQNAEGKILTANPAARIGLGIEWGRTDTIESFARLDPVHADGEPFQRDEAPAQIARRERVAQRNVIMGLLDDDGDRRWMTVSAVPVELGGELAVVTTLTQVADFQPTPALLRDSDERFRLLAEEAPIAIFIVGADGQMLYVNPASEQIAGRPSGDLREVGWLACIHPDDQQRLADGSDDFDNFEPVEYRVLRPDGTIRWVRASGAALRDRDDTIIGLVGTATDVTELRDADERLRDREERTRAILETAAEGIVSTNERGVILEFNAAAERIFGYDSDDVIEQCSFAELLAHDDQVLLREFMSGYLTDPPTEGARMVGAGARELTGRRKDGSTVPIVCAVTDLQTRGGRLFTAVIRDLSEQRAFEHELERLATRDPLTGLPNRTLITAQLESALARADRQRRLLAVLFIDIDRVKLVTEALGHRAGDELIAQAADRLRAAAGPAITLGRFSNDQFVAIVEDLDDVGTAVDTAITMIEAVSHPFVVAADEAFVNASVGIAFAIEGLGDAETLVSNADVAMGRAKSSSLSRYEVFDADMRAWVEIQRKTEIALRHGIDRHEFELYYQPVVELESTEVCGYEALVRWNHPDLGLLAPAEFIPVAEESGLIVPLGEQLLRDAIEQSARWRDEPGSTHPSKVAINLSARQLEHPGLVSLVREALERSGAEPDDVTFEITETVLLHDVDTVVHTLDELRALGVHLSLDDFGTGYSSLTYLCQLPIDTVKVDRSFVSQLGTGSRDASIVEMVVTMARTLQLDVVAEGVETEHQAEVLRGWGCRFAQGYLFARPSPVEELG